MDTANSLTVDLSIEEVIFLMNRLGIAAILGVGENPLVGAAPDAANLTLASGSNSLRARGWVESTLVDDEPTLVVDNILIAYLGTCASARRVLFLSRTGADGIQRLSYLHLGDKLTVIHSIPEPGVHRFTGTVEPEHSLLYLRQALQLHDQSAPDKATVTLRHSAYVAASETYVSQDAAAARSLLAEKGVGSGTADAVLALFASLRSNSLLNMMAVGAADERSQTQELGVIETDEGFWLIDADGSQDEDPVVTLRPTSAAALESELAQLLALKPEPVA